MRDLPMPTFPISDLTAFIACRRSLHRLEPASGEPEFEKSGFDVGAR